MTDENFYKKRKYTVLANDHLLQHVGTRDPGKGALSRSCLGLHQQGGGDVRYMDADTFTDRSRKHQ